MTPDKIQKESERLMQWVDSLADIDTGKKQKQALLIVLVTWAGEIAYQLAQIDTTLVQILKHVRNDP